MPPKPCAPSITKAKVSGTKHNRESEAYEEIYEDIETVRSVLVRFPCFDFFNHVGLCEETVNGTESEGSSPRTVFRPEAVHIDKNSLTTEHPTMVLNKGTEKEMHFRGCWSEIDTTRHITNRAILRINKHEAEEGGNAISDALEGKHATSTQDTGRPSLSTASLFAHAEVGITSDEARRMRESTQQWRYDLVEVPCATLVMERCLA